jgi:GDP-L-fucose synthase
VVPALIKKFITAKKNKNKSVKVWGDGSASREFLFVDDLCFIILEAVERIKSCGPFNVGTGRETTILNLAKTIQSVLGINTKIIWQKKMPNGQVRRNYDMKNFKKNFKFRKFSTLYYGLQKTIDWYIKNEKFLDK